MLCAVAHSSVIHVVAQASLDCWMYQCLVCCLLSLCLIELSWPRLGKLGWSEVLLLAVAVVVVVVVVVGLLALFRAFEVYELTIC